ncbi:MAG TPA: hypothetical protein VME69_15120 [Methylocella sp.]|nr:hypothetical protein [Methylocella sp.]
MALASVFAPPAAAQIATGTVMVSTGGGFVTEFTQNGTLLTQLNTETVAFVTGGSIFDAAGNFYVTDYNANQVTKFSPNGSLLGPFGGPYGGYPKSITLDKGGNVYVGDDEGTVRKFSPDGTKQLAFYSLALDVGDLLSITLGSDQCTLYYTSNGRNVNRFNICTYKQLTNFNGTALPGYSAFGLAVLPDGGILVNAAGVFRLDASGKLVQTYPLQIVGPLALDPDGTSFWTADLGGDVWKVNIASGALLQAWSAGGAPYFNLPYGLSVKGPGTNVPACGPNDAILVDETFPSGTGTLDYGVSSPTKVLQSISLIGSTNLSTYTLPTIGGNGHSATGGVFVKVNPSERATFELQATFAGPSFVCNIDPVTTTLQIKQGHQTVQSFHYIPYAEHFIEIDNGSLGLRQIRIAVNGKPFIDWNLKPGQTSHIDAASFMIKGNNTLTFTGEGRMNSFANISVSNSGPSAPGKDKSALTAQATGIWGRLEYEQ